MYIYAVRLLKKMRGTFKSETKSLQSLGVDEALNAVSCGIVMWLTIRLRTAVFAKNKQTKNLKKDHSSTGLSTNCLFWHLKLHVE